jgi:hypothetical protein
MTFGDFDPEDAWDDGDPDDDKLDILERVVDDLRQRRDGRFESRRRDALRLVAKLARSERAERIRRALEAL